MAVFKCKMCGGELEMISGSSTAECEYCGSKQTLPRVSDDRLAALYERANDLRMSHEFDKAIETYEKIIEENPTDADAYWSMVLCRYGIQYVEETKGGARKPTINRVQKVSIFEDVDFKAALRYADPAQDLIYREEAEKIDSILQKFLRISRNDPPYDVFICYKQTDANGEPTEDSGYARQIYHRLKNEFKVFFAPVTLKDKLGEEFEPHIFAAIHSAKVMVVIGTKPEYVTAPWVKNEWSRFLAATKDDYNRLLIPAYKGMKPEEFPEEFRYSQAQNMSLMGFMWDLEDCIKRVVSSGKPKKVEPVAAAPVTLVASAPKADVSNLLQRIGIFLDNQEWNNAEIYCEKVLDADPTNGKAYLYKLMAQARVVNESALQYSRNPLDTYKAYKNAVRYADESTTAWLIETNEKIKTDLAEQERLRREKEERDAQLRRQRNALVNARSNAQDRLRALNQERDDLQQRLSSSQYRAQNLESYKKKIKIPAILILITTAILLYLLSTDGDSTMGFTIMLVQTILALILANARGMSKVSAFMRQIFTCSFFASFSAIKSLIDISKMSTKELYKEQLSINTRLREIEEEFAESQRSLSELNGKLEALE